MARYHGPKCRLCRREGIKLNLKGTRCDGEKCTMNKRTQAPGQHGTSRRALSNFGKQLREKQKAKRIYGILERQFKNYVNEAMKEKGITGENLYRKLESRMDNMVYRSGFAVSRAQARQLVRRGLFEVNGKKATIPARTLRIGDTIKPVDFQKIHAREGFVLPDWLQANVKEKTVKYVVLPSMDELQERFDIQAIIESYSR
ncbi:30S ribosomal protein S4 [candidate division WWE3 bacterium RIFOXYC1_FULL_40_10]|uniref:Small ribosomal subunit protein uS4 n=1 Tax=candidate division WWE3 bacterium RIFOXYA2_FULL_46_9 TaxID=1802636 RepID=A0A1F4VYJ4_UNCKA|nr:MAG: 30S ribosomal protein S4 [candidate division WWE3 bacterium RIFOXYB1_FULL_40_22]OGC61890.1 MAG: 30S ribosomal protein S4 [candidate division WWE3 bacterium RIFOXYA1_FULL_40_11]OGC62257.1 MAG: 30S ribosomal protein S4 [candidate division WWE3 bacterium RIFOXYA2_FULL_46_9]OGC64362.1 MAG: 30S ribosomal protein S4 [candidate division WWE3 bacterium RIFOXYB2_FULL_41_6]OGC66273.1 MAG: 30S ribosomal protein S4 [candidate division WWE3 bacterium RIFOXYC1_FULL_40_10]OGC67876.1 MAG: 30S ribosoma